MRFAVSVDIIVSAKGLKGLGGKEIIKTLSHNHFIIQLMHNVKYVELIKTY